MLFLCILEMTKADIEVFHSLKGKELTIFVGNPSETTTADYFVYSPDEVKTFFEHLYNLKYKKRPRAAWRKRQIYLMSD